MGARISLDYISHKFHSSGPYTLKNIEDSIEPGELVALIGRSGCGKSTLLHMLAGLLQPSEGCVRINSRQVTKPSAKWNMMFQKASLYPWMSVKENAALGLLFAGTPKAEMNAKVDALLDMGFWGVPSFRLGQFTSWGNDRMWMLDELQRRAMPSD